VIDRIRYGGMGEVLKAQKVEDSGEITTWAVKRPLPTIAEDAELLGLFWKEAELMQKLQLPAFPRVAEVGVAQGLPFIVMEYIPGAAVQQILAARDEGRPRVRAEAWVLMASDLAAAVTSLHKVKKGTRMLVHGDIRSPNVMVDGSGNVRLLDLGMALANEGLWRRTLRGRAKDFPAPLLEKDRGPEFDTWSIARLLIDCLGGLAVLADNRRLPAGLIALLQRASDPSGLYLFRSARNLKWELQAYLDQSRLEAMRAELGAAAAAIHGAGPAAG
jgi:serine/threonine protein kinase